jgi:hypothetical protein
MVFNVFTPLLKVLGPEIISSPNACSSPSSSSIPPSSPSSSSDDSSAAKARIFVSHPLFLFNDPAVPGRAEGDEGGSRAVGIEGEVQGVIERKD